MTKKMLVGMFAAIALVACGGGTQASSSEGTGTASATTQGAEAPHIECGTGSGHHGGGCDDTTTATAETTTPSDGATPEGSTTTTTTTTTTP